MANSPKQATVCFLRMHEQLLLAQIEYAPDDRKWAGIGGFVELGESLEDGLLREVQEETYMQFEKEKLQKVAEIHMDFILHVFVTDTFTGQVKAKDPTIIDMLWYPISDLPYPFMHPGTDEWLPLILEGKYVLVRDGIVTEVASF